MNVLIHVPMGVLTEVLGPTTQARAHRWLKRNGFKRVTPRGTGWKPKEGYTHLYRPGGWSPMSDRFCVTVEPVKLLKDHRVCSAGGNFLEKPRKRKTTRPLK